MTVPRDAIGGSKIAGSILSADIPDALVATWQALRLPLGARQGAQKPLH